MTWWQVVLLVWAFGGFALFAFAVALRICAVGAQKVLRRARS